MRMKIKAKFDESRSKQWCKRVKDINKFPESIRVRELRWERR